MKLKFSVILLVLLFASFSPLHPASPLSALDQSNVMAPVTSPFAKPVSPWQPVAKQPFVPTKSAAYEPLPWEKPYYSTSALHKPTPSSKPDIPTGTQSDPSLPWQQQPAQPTVARQPEKPQEFRLRLILMMS